MSFKDGWREYKLGELYNIFSGLSKGREEFGFGYPFLSFKEIFNNWFLPETLDNLVNTSEIEREKCSVTKGDIFLTRTSESQNELGMSSVALKDYPNATFNGFTKRLRIKKDISVKIDNLYIGYYLRCPKFRNQINSISSMTTRASLNNGMIENLKIELPTIETQNRIGEILNSLDKKVELNRQMNKTLEETAQTLFREMCLPKGEELPEGWMETGIGKLAKIQNGFAFKSKDFSDEGTAGVIKIKNISGNVVDIINMQYIPESVASKVDAKRFLLHSGELLIAMTGAEVGKIGLIPKNEKALWLNQRVGCFKEKTEFANYYIYLLLTTEEYQNIIRNTAMGSAQPNISASAIEEIKAIIPPEVTINEFGKIVKPLFEQMLENYAEIEILSSTRDKLLPKLMNGELEV